MVKPHIIIIDDSPVNIQILMQALAREYRLTPFSSSLEAVDFLTKHPSCDIVLLDIDMPDANGYETFERIRRITGYLVGTVDRFNNAKAAEERDRLKHELK